MGFTSKHNGAQIESYLNSIPNKQDKLVSGQSIKTINGQSVLGEGDITIEGSGEVDTSSIEKVTAAALNDLNKRVKVLPTSIIVDDKIAKAVSEVNANHDGDIAEVNASVTDLLNEVVRNEKILAHAINDLKTQIDDLYSKINAQ